MGIGVGVQSLQTIRFQIICYITDTFWTPILEFLKIQNTHNQIYGQLAYLWFSCLNRLAHRKYRVIWLFARVVRKRDEQKNNKIKIQTILLVYRLIIGDTGS